MQDVETIAAPIALRMAQIVLIMVLSVSLSIVIRSCILIEDGAKVKFGVETSKWRGKSEDETTIKF